MLLISTSITKIPYSSNTSNSLIILNHFSSRLAFALTKIVISNDRFSSRFTFESVQLKLNAEKLQLIQGQRF